MVVYNHWCLQMLVKFAVMQSLRRHDVAFPRRRTLHVRMRLLPLEDASVLARHAARSTPTVCARRSSCASRTSSSTSGTPRRVC